MSLKDNKYRIAVIDKDKCKPKKCRHECQKKCPVNQSSKMCIEIEEIAKISENLCIGCGICQIVCPFNAIKIVNLPSELQTELVYSYGENMFRLYKLPNPKQGKIIGILGQNGTGKSTIMNILAGKILPNFGNETITESEILKRVRGNEIQKYFKLLYDNKLTITVKPQNILGLVKNSKDATVGEIINKYDSNERNNHIINELELNKLSNNTIETLSGGELQKLSCAITLMKDADVFIFDEITNYLDIEYRIKIANLIKELNTHDKYIFVVDHDLSILDFITDYIHIMYGEPGAYGVVATLYNTLEAINIYFEGYIPADNMKFRREPFKLNDMQQIDNQDKSMELGYLSYDETIIKYNNFELKINGNKLSSETNMVIILGRNGTGKSTYLKFLANNLGLNISFKQQINDVLDITNDPKISVQTLLYNKIKDAMVSEMFISDVIKLLGINKIYNKKVRKLSGGELQRLSITLCLGTPANIYLLDEAASNLDIEQRFNATKAIRRFLMHTKKIGFIVEHDILMAITLAKEQNSEIIVFEEVKAENNIRYCTTSSFLDFNTGINKFLKNINTTFRTDYVNKRPKINKLNSTNDKEQKGNQQYYI
jgi:ATP-binding cassette subfamily E protein 1